jgi:hypothetical protein
MVDPNPVSGAELLPRYLFLGAAISGRRVLEIGALSAVGTEGAKLCLDLGAREVTVLGDADEVRAHDHLDLPPSLNLWEEDDALPPKARFDLIVVHRPSALSTTAQREAWKGRLTPGGHLVIAVQGAFDRGGPSYAELVGPLNQLFASVQVVLQRPFTGHALVPFGVDGPPRIDGRLGRDAPPSHYLLICGEVPLPIEGPAVLATQSPPPAEATDRKDAPMQDVEQLRLQLAKGHAAVREREQWLAELRVELEERDAALATREHEARLAAGEAATARRDAEAYRDDRDHARHQLQNQKEDIAAALARSKAAEAERDELREKVAQAAPPEEQTATSHGAPHAELKDTLEQLAAAIDRARRTELELDEAVTRDVRLAREVRELVAKLGESEGRAEALQREVDVTSKGLAESERARTEIEAEVARLIADLREERNSRARDAPAESTPPAPPSAPPPTNGGASDDVERLRISLRDREDRLALLRRELTDKAERISRLLAELHEAKTKGLRLFNR